MFRTARRAFPASGRKNAHAQKPLPSHYIQDVNTVVVMPVENPARTLNKLPVAPALEFLGFGPELGVVREQVDVLENALYKLPRRLWVVEGDVICNDVKVG